MTRKKEEIKVVNPTIKQIITMKEIRFFYVPSAATLTEMPMEEALHALRVLRLKSGDEMFLMDGEGNFYRAEVTLAATKRCMYEIKETLPQAKTWKGNIHIAIAPTKVMDRIEWFCEKATEIGVDEITFLNCKFSERKVMRTVRLDKIVVAAVKQSHKPWKPSLNAMVFTPSLRVRSHSLPLVSSPVRFICTRPAQRCDMVLHPIISISPAFSSMRR